MLISIIILTYNAPKYVFKTLYSLNKTENINYEVIVVDNKSGLLTKILLVILKIFGYIDKIALLSENTLFAKGNNIGSRLISNDSDYILLLNSDVKIIDKCWLKKLSNKHKKGIISYGVVESNPIRADGYCFLINTNLYQKYELDESFEWWWSITKLQTQILKEGHDVIAIKNHDNYIVHYGGKSKNKDLNDVKGMDIEIDEIMSWFKDNKIKIIDLNKSLD
jgi:glycosyltransferase involved in cell wall biosynthesis